MIASLLAGLALGAAPEPAPWVPLAVRAVPFPGLEEPRTVGCATLRAGVTLEADEPGFGGYSDVAYDPADGTALIVSDAGHVLSARLETDEAGDATGLGGARLAGLVERDGSRLGKRDGDAEGLARLGAGYVVSLEGEDRIARMSPRGVLGRTAYPPEEVEAVLGFNSGFEALVALPDGTLLAISEGTDAEGEAVVLRGRLGQPMEAWRRAAYRPAPAFGVTGAALDPGSGDLFVLERAYSPWRGARMRVVRVPAAALDDERVAGAQVTRMGFLEGVDNMEAIAAARTADGALRLYLLSDDNFSSAQRTVLLTLGLAPGCDDGDAP